MDATLYLSRLYAPAGKRVLETYNTMFDMLPPQAGDKILDVGCGKGPLAIFLRSKVPDIDITLSDIYKFDDLPEEKFVLASMTSLPFPDESFDKVYCMGVLAHLEDQKEAVKEAMRVLKKGGKMIVHTSNKYFVWALRCGAFLGFIPPLRRDPTAKWEFSKRSLSRLLGCKVYYLRKSPRNLPFQFLREKLVAVVVK